MRRSAGWRALIASTDMKDARWLEPGAALNGWRLVEIGADRVALEQGGEKVELQLYVDNSPNAIGSPVINP